MTENGRCNVLRCAAHASVAVHDAVHPLVKVLSVFALVSEDLLHTVTTAEDGSYLSAASRAAAIRRASTAATVAFTIENADGDISVGDESSSLSSDGSYLHALTFTDKALSFFRALSSSELARDLKALLRENKVCSTSTKLLVEASLLACVYVNSHLPGEKEVM